MKTRILYLLLLFSSYIFSQIPTNKLVAKYDFSNGATFTDSANAQNLTQNGTALTQVTDRFGNPNNAISLNGDYLTRTDFNEATNIAYSFWIKTSTNTTDYKTIIDNGQRNGGTVNYTGNQLGHHIDLRTGKIVVSASMAQTNAPPLHVSTHSSFIADGNWHHVAVRIYAYTQTGSLGRVQIFIDGILDGDRRDSFTGIYTGNTLNTSGNVVIGHNRNTTVPANLRYNDVIDDLLIYNNRTLSQQEILNIISTAPNGQCATPFNNIVNINAVTKNSASISINSSASNNYDIAYHKASEPFSNATILNNISPNTNTTIPSLIDNTLYRLYIRRKCSPSLSSLWSVAKTFTTSRATPTILYVNHAATGNNDGRSWANAFTSLQQALSYSTDNDEIWIAGGTYKPHSSNRTTYFEITKENLKIYGGFAGTETQISDRIFGANETILSGDLQGNDAVLTNNYINSYNDATRDSDNSLRIIDIKNTGENLLLDRLTISDAHNTSTTIRGGAIMKHKQVRNLHLKNCVIKNNVSRNDNAGLYAEFELLPPNPNGELKIENCQFIKNMSRWASGVYCITKNDTKINTIVVNTLFDSNIAADLSSSDGLSGSAGWFRNTGNTSSEMNMKFINNTFVNNIDTGTQQSLNRYTRATLAISTNKPLSSIGSTTAEVSNCIFWNNTTVNGAATHSITDMHKSPIHSLTVTNSIDILNFTDNSIHSVVSNNYSNPLFTDLANNDYTLQAGSPAINTGDNTKIPTGITTDLQGNQRISDTTVDMGAYEFLAPTVTTTWTGALSVDWNNIGNWDNGIPNANTNAIIPSNIISPQVRFTNQIATVKNLEIKPGGNLIIDDKNAITIEGNLILNGNIGILSDPISNGSLILKGTFSGSGDVEYHRNVTNNWHLISSPVLGVSTSNFQNNIATNGVKFAFATYNNSSASSRYNYYTTSAGNNDINTAGNLITAKGYSIKRVNAGAIYFKGNLNTSDVSIPITDGSATGNKWNLIGNPFTASINGNTNANANNNFLTVNASLLDPARTAMYVWNAATSSYDIINQASPTKYIAPGQGFFVEAKNGGGTVQFTEAMQSHQTGNIFSRSANKTPSITINITQGKQQKSTEIKYLEKATKGLDVGYDAGVFTGNSTKFNIYSKLVAKNNTTPFALQCLPNSKYNEMIIPLGVSSNNNDDITFSAKALNLPKGINVYLEDKEKNQFVQIDEKDYTTTVQTDNNNSDRFFIHTTTSIKNINHSSNNLNVFMSEAENLKIICEANQKASIKVFNVIGQEVFSKAFVSKNANNLVLPKLSSGVYIVNLNTEKQGTLSKKVIIE